MRVEFNALNQVRKPTLILCNPNGEELNFLGMAKNIEYSKEYNETSSLSFTIPKYKDNTGDDEDFIEYYDRLVTNRIVKLENEGTYLINKIDRSFDSDGAEYKEVQCVGLEYEFADKTIAELKGTYCLYDATGSSKDKELMHFLLTHYIPTWSISEVDSELWNVFRTFELKDKNIFNLLMGEVAKSFDCVFLFDTFNKTIKIVKTKNIHKQTDIYISAQNLMKSLNIEEDSDSLITALSVFGGGDLTIRNVNPTGGVLYNFDYFINNDFLSPELAEAIKVWENKCEANQSVFTGLLNQLKTKNSELLALQTQKSVLEAQERALVQHHAIAVTAGDNEFCTKYKNEIAAKNAEIATKQNEINIKTQEIATVQISMDNLVFDLSMDNPINFTSEQKLELNPYIKQGSVTNDDFIITDIMTLEEITQTSLELMEWGKEQLEKCSQPIWNFDVDVVSFTSLIEYKDFTQQLEMGSEIVIEVDKTKDLYAYTTLIGYTINIDDNTTTLSFSNQLNYKSKTLTFDELFENSASITKDYTFDLTNRTNNDKTTVKMDEYIEKGFVDITKELLATTNQEFVMSNTGIRGKEWIPETQTYSGEEIWMTKNVLAFSDDNFATTRTAIGKVTLPDGTKTYGVIAENLVGKQILGKTLLLETANKSLVWDGENLTIRNANIIVGDDKFLDETLQQIEGVANTANQTANTANATANTANQTANSASGKINRVVDTSGNLLADKLAGTINAGKANVVLGAGSNFMKLNENGILITKDGGQTYNTAIGVDGIIADEIKSGGHLSGCHLSGGSAIFGKRNIKGIREIEITDLGFLTGYYADDGDAPRRKTFSFTTQYDGAVLNLHDPRIDPAVGNPSVVKLSGIGDTFASLNAYNRHFTIRVQDDWQIKMEGLVGFVNGFYSYGEKDALIPTQHYGTRTLYCEEADRVYFTTKGVSHTTNNKCIITLDPVFTETIELNSSYPYIIQLTPYSDARIWIEQVSDYDFIVKSDKDTQFTYELSAIRITYGEKYLEEKFFTDKKMLAKVQRDGIDRMNKKYKEKEVI